MAGAAQLAMFAKQNEQDAWRGIGDVLDQQRSAILARELAEYGDLSQEGVTKFAQQRGLNLANPRDMALVSNAQDTAQKFFDFARAKKEAEQSDTLFGYNKAIAENQVNQIPVENERAGKRFGWDEAQAGRDVTQEKRAADLFNYEMGRRPTVDRLTDEEAAARNKLLNAQAGYYEQRPPYQPNSAEIEAEEREQDRQRVNENRRLAGQLNSMLKTKDGQMGRVAYTKTEDEESFTGVVADSQVDAVIKYFEDRGYGVDIEPTGNDYDVPGKFWDNGKENIITGIYKLDGTAPAKTTKPGTQGVPMNDALTPEQRAANEAAQAARNKPNYLDIARQEKYNKTNQKPAVEKPTKALIDMIPAAKIEAVIQRPIGKDIGVGAKTLWESLQRTAREMSAQRGK